MHFEPTPKVPNSSRRNLCPNSDDVFNNLFWPNDPHHQHKFHDRLGLMSLKKTSWTCGAFPKGTDGPNHHRLGVVTSIRSLLARGWALLLHPTALVAGLESCPEALGPPVGSQPCPWVRRFLPFQPRFRPYFYDFKYKNNAENTFFISNKVNIEKELNQVVCILLTNLTWLQVVVGGDRIGRPAGVV